MHLLLKDKGGVSLKRDDTLDSKLVLSFKGVEENGKSDISDKKKLFIMEFKITFNSISFIYTCSSRRKQVNLVVL